MSEHLEKARGALAAASSLDHSDPLYVELLDVAQVQAAVATAAALEAIERQLTTIALRLVPPPRSNYGRAADSALVAKAKYVPGIGGNQEASLATVPWPISPNGDVS